jgi:hypothetical protein
LFLEFPMPRPAATDGQPKPKRNRVSGRKPGMKLIRIWVPDPDAPGFAEEAARQAALLRGSPDEEEALDFIEKAGDWSDD